MARRSRNGRVTSYNRQRIVSYLLPGKPYRAVTEIAGSYFLVTFVSLRARMFRITTLCIVPGNRDR